MAAVPPGVGITNPGSAGAPTAVAPGVTQPVHTSTHHSSQQSQQDNPISNVKADIPQLNKSLSNLMKIAADNFVHNATVDNNGKVGDTTTLHRFDKALEDFYSHCDYIEVNLRLALECSRQHGYSVRYTPIQLPLAKQEPNVLDTQKYGQYANLVKTQIACVNDVQKALLDCAYNISHHVKREETANKP